ncbi:hypothetical protein J6590_088313 [Homalodisca vitripennis]|nr:hypothetical protein J6590_088313 [Homalodisca vitripennis]
MDDETFSYVLEKVRPRIERQDTNLRKAITAEQRLVATKNVCVSSRRGKYRRVFAARERKITSKDTPLSARGAGLVHTLAGWHGGRWHGTPKIKPMIIDQTACLARRPPHTGTFCPILACRACTACIARPVYGRCKCGPSRPP